MKKQRWKIGCALLFFFINVWAAQVTGVSATQSGSKTSLFFSIQGPFTHKIVRLHHPERVILELNDTHLNIPPPQLQLTNILINQVQATQLNEGVVRLTFTINQPVSAMSSPWSVQGVFQGIRVDFDSDEEKYALPDEQEAPVVSLAPTVSKAVTRPSVAAPRTLSPATHSSQSHPIVAHHQPVGRLRDVIVVIDAGHGGKDPGARGPNKSQEKYVVLAIALKLKQLIDKQPGMKAVLTRSGDYYVGLRDRLAIARRYNGDIFVSIHADAFNNPQSSGASVFALSQSGATSEAARWIAEKENYSELGGVNLGGLDDRNGVVRSVLIDLSQTATINASLEMGARVLSQLHHFTRLHNHKVEQARFMVLKSPDIPSILVETGFISNPKEERNLTSTAYQVRLSQAIFAGIKEHFWSNPPHGTRIESMRSSHLHIVRQGDTWPAIAARYKTSVRLLHNKNHLPLNALLHPGQKLELPA